jgi:hypothetical protein
VTGTGVPENNRRIGRNTLLLQMINPAPASKGPKSRYRHRPKK